MLKTQVLIIGGGASGTGLARDLALRGVHCIVAEQGDINSGASGANHGLLHSGGRYVFTDPDVAAECRVEAELLKQMAPQCIETTGGLFVAVEGDDEKYAADFPNRCAACGIPVKAITPHEARELEPALSSRVIAAYMVEDATIDPFMLSLQNMFQARQHGTTLLRHHQVTGFHKHSRQITSADLISRVSGEKIVVEAKQVVNAAGAWSGEIAALAGAHIKIAYSKGTLLVTHSRLTNRVINRLRKPDDGDILVPGGTVSILGTTSERIDDLDQIFPTVREADRVVTQGGAMVPDLETTRYIRAYAGVRPLISSGTDTGDRDVSRGFMLLDHLMDGLENFTTISGGKLTTYRYMAEKTADLVCSRLGVTRPCLTRINPLPPAVPCSWTEPGIAPRRWMKKHTPGDLLLCECEMVSTSAVDNVIASLKNQNGNADLTSVALRTRVGKGACQGAFCGFRVAAHMYNTGQLRADAGIDDLKNFFRERWKGLRPVLWDGQMIQTELTEALHCGFLGLEIEQETLS
jgi:glycerol-3-phosphate dehydrogenase